MIITLSVSPRFGVKPALVKPRIHPHCPIRTPAIMAERSFTFSATALQAQFTVSPLLRRLLNLHDVASTVLETLSDNHLQNLRAYYNFALIRRRQVVRDVPDHVWKFDLACNMACVLFARERVTEDEYSADQLHSMIEAYVPELCADVSEPWFEFVTRNARRPTMIAMPSMPGINLGEDEERFYIQAVTDTWPSKTVSTVEEDVLKIAGRASRRFVGDEISGDLEGVELSLSEHEISFAKDHSIGWVTRYETTERTVTIIEIDPWTKGELNINEDARRRAYDLVKVPEQRLDMYKLDMLMHEDDSFNDNFVLSRLLTVDISNSPFEETAEEIDIREYIHVDGAGNDGLGAVDEEVFVKSLGSITAKNKLRSALSIAAKARLMQLKDHGEKIRNVRRDEVAGIQSMLVRSSVEGLYIRTNVPFDSVFVFALFAVVSSYAVRALIILQGVQTVGQTVALAIVGTLGAGWMYHSLRYKDWPLSEAIRLRRMCWTDEEMQQNMSKHQVLRTIADAGAKGARMDGILTCAFSASTDGRFAMTKPLLLEEASKVGMKLRLGTNLQPLWVDLRGVRAVRDRGTWHAYGPYLDKSFLRLTAAGPETIGDAFCYRKAEQEGDSHQDIHS